jgi:RNA polymerase-interacting CarD/CdnL/TRCF family regulator
VEFIAGQVIVYGGHGPGRVVALESRGASPEPQQVVVVELAAALTVTLPIALAHEQLRAVVNETELANVQTTLRATPRASEPLWIRRQKATRAKLASGQAICLAEVISDGAHRQRALAKRLSLNERELYCARDDFSPTRSATPAASTNRKPKTG